jgi:ring-1,2-phenylacetyl-CoA epoxidase subunit PaaA
MQPNGKESFRGPVKDAAEARKLSDEYVLGLTKIIASHTINELYGAQVYDEPAIAFAPTPYEKWLTCRIAMEEYGHHVRFKRLADQLGIEEEKLDPSKRHLSIFDYQLKSWTEFVTLKAIVDLAEILQMEDLLECSYEPLKDLSVKLMPEEKYHAGFGRNRMTELCKTPEGKAEVQKAVDIIFPFALPFFGQSKSSNNELFRRWGIKQRTNGMMRGDFICRVEELLKELELEMPPVPKEYQADLEEYKAARVNNN